MQHVNGSRMRIENADSNEVVELARGKAQVAPLF
jgi:hypothetical protein